MFMSRSNALMKSLTLHQLRLFKTTVDRGSFTRAAQELFLTQPTVSVQLKQLTQAVGMPLLEQVNGQLCPTAAGQEVLSLYEDVFATLTGLELTLADYRDLQKGTLRLTLDTTAQYLILPVLRPFRNRYPGIHISLEITNASGAMERLRNNCDDLYVLNDPPQTEEIKTKSFLDNPLVVVAPNQHPLTQQHHIPLERLAQQAFILQGPGSSIRDAVLRHFEQHHCPLTDQLELSSNESVIEGILAGLGLSAVSLHFLNTLAERKKLTILDIQGFPIQQKWKIAYPKQKQLSMVASAFLSYLLDQPPVRILKGEGKPDLPATA
jgi:LysR family transcriptional regulator, low CO2-responsive transcriptional regulator